MNEMNRGRRGYSTREKSSRATDNVRRYKLKVKKKGVRSKENTRTRVTDTCEVCNHRWTGTEIHQRTEREICRDEERKTKGNLNRLREIEQERERERERNRYRDRESDRQRLIRQRDKDTERDRRVYLPTSRYNQLEESPKQ